jgi:hypothetical protein
MKVIKNDLLGAYSYADVRNRRILGDICKFVSDVMPYGILDYNEWRQHKLPPTDIMLAQLKQQETLGNGNHSKKVGAE